MPIQDQPAAETVVVEIAGKVTIGPDAKMRDAIQEATDAGAQNVLLKMDRVTKIDSSGVGELAAAHERIRKDGGRFLLVGLADKLAVPLIYTNLIHVLERYPNVEEALAALENPLGDQSTDS
jgi:anti-anti-sigma factor